jgi:hypothetical protein
MNVFYQGRYYPDAGVLQMGGQTYYQLAGIGNVPESWVQVEGDIISPPPLLPLPHEGDESIKQSARRKDGK